MALAVNIAVNKTDLRGEVMILYDEYQVQQFAGSIGARWFMTSAKTGDNVERIFSALASDIVARMNAPREEIPV